MRYNSTYLTDWLLVLYICMALSIYTGIYMYIYSYAFLFLCEMLSFESSPACMRGVLSLGCVDRLFILPSLLSLEMTSMHNHSWSGCYARSNSCCSPQRRYMSFCLSSFVHFRTSFFLFCLFVFR